MPFADAETLENHIADILNANAGVWGGPVAGVDGRRSLEAIANARRSSAYEVLRAVASYPEGGYFGELAELVEVEHDDFLPGHDGEPGIPQIIPFDGATARAGIPADPDAIDSYREDPLGLYTGALGVATAHDQPDANGMPSPVSCRYSIVSDFFKFTGLSAAIPLIVITDEKADEKVPLSLAPTVVKLSIPKLVKEGDNLYLYSREYYAMGQEDLIGIMGGMMKVRPIPQPQIITAQKQSI